MKSINIYRIFRIIVAIIFLVLIPVLIFNYYLWTLLTKIYVITAVFFLLYRFAAWFYADFNPPKNYNLSDEPYTLIIPVKDEEPSLFIKAVEMAVAQQGRKEILIGDDGSSIPVGNLLKDYPELYKKVRIFRSEKNIGKKSIQVRLIERAKYDIIVEIDSDVVMQDETTAQQLIAPLQNKMVGITNGYLSLFNPRKKILNRVESIMYYCANQIGRRSWGNFGINPVASGQLLAIRKSYFIPLINEYSNRTFLGNRINFGEDRLMTNLLLRAGYKSVYVESAKSKSVGCESLTKYVKQQTRWRRSGIRESLFLLTFSKNFYLIALVASRLLLPFIFTLLFVTSLLSSVLSGYFWYIPIILGILIIVTVISDIPLIMGNYRRLPDLIFFALCNVLILSPLWVYALLTLNKTGWGTR